MCNKRPKKNGQTREFSAWWWKTTAVAVAVAAVVVAFSQSEGLDPSIRAWFPPSTHRLHLGRVVPHVDVGVLQGLVHRYPLRGVYDQHLGQQVSGLAGCGATRAHTHTYARTRTHTHAQLSTYTTRRTRDRQGMKRGREREDRQTATALQNVTIHLDFILHWLYHRTLKCSILSKHLINIININKPDKITVSFALSASRM